MVLRALRVSRKAFADIVGDEVENNLLILEESEVIWVLVLECKGRSPETFILDNAPHLERAPHLPSEIDAISGASNAINSEIKNTEKGICIKCN